MAFIHKIYVGSLNVFCLLLFFSTLATTAQSRQAMQNEVKKWVAEIEKTQEIIASVYTRENPCGENVEKWIKENPGKKLSFMGVVESSNGKPETSTVRDALFYLEMMDCENQTFLVSTPGIYFYPEEGELKSNPDITSEVEKNIQEILREKNISFSRVVVTFRGLSELAYGKYYVFQDGDEICCPSREGSFKHDPIKNFTALEF